MGRSIDDLRRRADAVLNAALDEEPRDLTRWLDDACGGDSELRGEVEELLRLVAKPLTLLEQDPLAEVRREALDEALDEAHGEVDHAAGSLVGPYRICHELGRGGMGVVYLAERADGQFDQRVALKLIRWGMVSDEIRHRFRRERQILANLNHPNIARLLDGGVGGDGRSFFAMEYVDGEPIDRYSDRLRLPVRRRVELMVEVARAVQYAHRNLVIHRDLKPSNLVVTGDGGVRLLDFGIARLLVPASGDSLTHAGGGPMTPEYASPEQLSGQPVTTASDIYQLGLLLYELLVGRRPAGGFDAAPSRPSTALARCAELAAIAAARGTTPGALARELRGDLDTIVLMALRSEPERRYATAEALADDLERFLSGHAVVARGDSVPYRTTRFARRHKLALTAGVVILALIVSYAVTVTQQARALTRERDRVLSEATKVTEVKDFLVGLFNGADPSTPEAQSITARELVARGDRRMQRELTGQPAVLGELLEVIGTLYGSLGSYDDAIDRLERAVRLHQQVYGDSSREAGDSLLKLADLYREMGEYDRAEPLLQAVVAARRTQLGGEGQPALGGALDDLGLLYAEQGEYGRAEASLREALAILRRCEGDANPKTIQTLSNLALTLKWKGDYDAAEPLMRECCELTRKIRGDNHLDVAWATERLAVLLGQRGDYSAAEPMLRDALEMATGLLGERHPDVALMTNNLAKLYTVSGRPREAEPYLRRALELNRTIFGPEHRRVATNLANLGQVYSDLGEHERAIPLLEESATIRRRELGPDHPEVALSLHYLARAELGSGHVATAAALYAEALAVAEQAWDHDHPFRADILVGAGETALAAGRRQDAIALLEEAVALQTLDPELVGGASDIETVLAVNRAVEELAGFNPRMAQVVECRFFVGMTEEEIAAALDVSVRSVQRDWVRARAWLHRMLAAPGDGSD